MGPTTFMLCKKVHHQQVHEHLPHKKTYPLPPELLPMWCSLSHPTASHTRMQICLLLPSPRLLHLLLLVQLHQEGEALKLVAVTKKVNVV
jgi:hypothetical protein